MDFSSAKLYIDKLNKFGSVLGLDNMMELLKALDHPENKLKIIHFAGTNGKGSTITYVEAILRQSGYTTAKYMSPTVFEYLEKYQINGKNIDEEIFVKAVEVICKKLNMLNERNIYPTIFEVETAIAFWIFANSNVDVVLLETGMGGDLDATNVTDKVLLSVITSISYDHMAFLGNTIEEIAAHKAGIIKRNCPVAVNGVNEAALKVIKEAALKNNSRISVSARADMKTGTYTSYSGNIFSGIKTKLMGSYQEENIALAIESILLLNELYGDTFNISKENIIEGIKNAFIPGRFEKISENPKVYIDGAHNPDAINKLKRTICEHFYDKRKVFIMGVLADKDYENECKSICSLADFIITVTPDNARALSAEKLKETVKRYNENVYNADSLKAALDKAISFKPEVIVAFGSLSYLGEFKKLFKEKQTVLY